jgi:hypothetical protein
MMEIIPKHNCPLKFMKNLLELFGNIDTDRNLIMEWNELLEYILDNSQFVGKQLLNGIPEEEKLELFHSNKSNFALRFGKRKLFISKNYGGRLMGNFLEKSNNTKLILMNPKNCQLEIYFNKFSHPSCFK